MSTDTNETGGSPPKRIVVRFGEELLEEGFTSVPNLVIRYYASLRISPAEMMFIVHLWQFWWTEKDPHPSLGKIAVQMHITRRQAQKYVASLRQKGYLTVEERYAPGQGQQTSEYDFSRFLQVFRLLSVVLQPVEKLEHKFQVADGLGAIFAQPDEGLARQGLAALITQLRPRFPAVAQLLESSLDDVIAATRETPTNFRSRGGANSSSRAPANHSSPEEYEAQSDEVSSNAATHPLSVIPDGPYSKFRNGSRQDSDTRIQPKDQPTPGIAPAEARPHGPQQLRDILTSKGIHISLPKPAATQPTDSTPPPDYQPRTEPSPNARAPQPSHPTGEGSETTSAPSPTGPRPQRSKRLARPALADPDHPNTITEDELGALAAGEREASQPRQRGNARVSAQERQSIQAYLGDFAPELGDQAPFKSSVSRVANIYADSGLTMPAFVQRLYSARSRTKERYTSIRDRTKRFAYFCALLEEECSLREPPPEIAAAAKAKGEEQSAKGTAPPERKSLAGKYWRMVQH